MQEGSSKRAGVFIYRREDLLFLMLREGLPSSVAVVVLCHATLWHWERIMLEGIRQSIRVFCFGCLYVRF